MNISQTAATTGKFIAQVLWFDNQFGFPDHAWLEIGDTAGTGQMQGRPNMWERWWYWVDGYTEGVYREWGIAMSPSDSLSRTYEVRYDGTQQGGWGFYIGASRYASKQWIDPIGMSNQSLAVGMEVHLNALTADTNTGPFEDKSLEYRNMSNGWISWTSGTIYSQTDNGCGSGHHFAPSCLNGWWYTTPAPGYWANNKPSNQ